MIDKAYFYFLKSKYTKEITAKELVNLKDLFAKSYSLGVPVYSLSNFKRAGIEAGVLGRELTEYERKVDNYILKTPSIVRAFLQVEFEKKEETLEELQKSIQKIRESILDNLSIEAREGYLSGSKYSTGKDVWPEVVTSGNQRV